MCGFVLFFENGGITLGQFETLVSDGMISMYRIDHYREQSKSYRMAEVPGCIHPEGQKGVILLAVVGSRN